MLSGLILASDSLFPFRPSFVPHKKGLSNFLSTYHNGLLQAFLMITYSMTKDRAKSEGKGFLGTSMNALMTRVWIAKCVYFMLAYIKSIDTISLSLQQMTRLLQLQLNLFKRRELQELFRVFREYPPEPKSHYFRRHENMHES
jgi:hypothetical protein